MRDERGEGRGRKGRGLNKTSEKVPKKVDAVEQKRNSIIEEAGDISVSAASVIPGKGLEKFNGLLEEIEHLLFQSTQGHHFMFDNADIARVMSTPSKEDVFSDSNMNRVQRLFSGLLDSRTYPEKRSYLERLNEDEFNLLVRAYFQLVDKTMLANYEQRH